MSGSRIEHIPEITSEVNKSKEVKKTPPVIKIPEIQKQEALENDFNSSKVEKLMQGIDNNDSGNNTIKQKAKEVLEQKKSELDKKLREKANKKIPFIGEFLYDWAKGLTEDKGEKAGFFDKIFGKIGKTIGLFILDFLGLKKEFEEMKNMKETKEENKGNNKKEDTKKEKKTKASEEKNSEDTEIIEEQKDFYYLSGTTILMHLSENKNPDKIIKRKFKNKTLKELENIKNTKKIDGKDLTDQEFTYVKLILSEKSQILLKAGLKKEVLEKTLEHNKLKLQNLFGQTRFEEIQKQVKENNFDIKSLKLYEISILFLFSFNSFGLLAISGIGEKFKGIFDSFGNEINIENFKEIIENKDGLISKELISKLNNIDSIYRLKASSSDEKIKREIGETSEELNKLLSFKNWLLGNEFLGGKSLLNETGKQKEFKQNLSYAGVIALYDLFGGEKNLDNLNTLELPVFYKIISLIIGRQNPAIGSDYITEILTIIGDNKESSKYFKDENDKKALIIVGESLGSTYIKFIAREITEKLGKIGLFANKISKDLTAIGVGYLAKGIGGKMMKKGLLFEGAWLKKFGYLAIFSGIASAIHTSYNNGSELFRELSLFNKEDINNLSEEQIKKLGEQAENLNKRIITKEINGEKILLFESKNNGLEVIYKGNIYKLGVGFSRIGSIEKIGKDLIGNVLDNDWVNKITSELPNDYQEKINKLKNNTKRGLLTFRGKEYNFSKVKISSNKLIIGEGSNILELDLNDFLNKVAKSQIVHPEKIFGNEENKDISYKIIEPGFSDDNLILIKQGEIKTSL